MIPPRPDMRWTPGVGRKPHEPTQELVYLPAPPSVPVMVPVDLVDEVTRYVKYRNLVMQRTMRRVR